MTTGNSSEPTGFAADVPGWRLSMARASLFWERLWPAACPAVAVAGVFTAVAWLDVLPSLLHPWLHVIVLLGFAAAFLFALWHVRFALPTVADSVRRIEVLSGVAHRPLTTLRDHLVAGEGDPMSLALWDSHRRRMREMLGGGRVGLPAPGMARRDPWAFRAALGLLLVVAAVVAGPEEWSIRWSRAAMPSFKSAENTADRVVGFEVWITPPAYTGLPTLLPTHKQRGAEPLSVAVGSSILVQVIGGREAPTIQFGEGAPVSFETIDEGSFRLTSTINSGNKLVVTQAKKTLADWPMEIVPDRVPQVAHAAAPQRNQRLAIRLEFEAADDYGLAAVRAFVRKAPRADGTGVTMIEPEEAIELQLPLPSQRPKAAHAASFHDLTPHPWAGLSVLVQLRAVDALGQSGVSDDFAMTLPERVFVNPLAKAIIAQRKVLSVDPGQRRQVSDALRGIGSRPEQYFEDIVTFLSLRTAALRLLRDSSADGTKAVQSLLWDTALRIEDGKVSVAQRDVRNLQQKLMEALANNASPEEIKRLMDELRTAMDRMFQEMMQQALRPDEQRQPQEAGQQPDPNARSTGDNDLRKMLEQAQKLAEAGMKDQAREMIQKMQDMMDKLRQAQQQGDQERARQAQQMAKEVQDLAKRQQQLLDQNFRQQQQAQRGQPQQQQQQRQQGQQGQGQDQKQQEGSQPGVSERLEGRGQSQGQQGANPGRQEGEGGGQGTAAYQQQEQLRRDLGEVMRRLGEAFNNIPDTLGNAEQSMREASNALLRGQLNQALRPQSEAVENMMKGLRQMAQQQMQAQGEGEDGDPSNAEMRDRQLGDSRDPAGRPLNGLGGIDARDIRIPDEADIQRSREIQDELLRRASERERPQIERDYLERLLKRF
ncbi:MAG: TIGR02302 family protein [Rhodospirillaceae bacterium]|nr:TIGR02302 family protein [Rhodospirillaceae bacterium]